VDEAIAWLEQPNDEISVEIRNALLDRLIFRREFLSSLDLELDVVERRSTPHLCSCIHQIQLIDKSSMLGKPVDDAFSVKIQRRLASTVPPRPMVKIDFDDAVKHMARFFQDLVDVQSILDYSGTYNLRVSVPSQLPVFFG
jgi:hypothetical protein